MGYRLEGSVEASLVLGHHRIQSWGRDHQSGVTTVSLGFVPYGLTGAPPPSKRKDFCTKPAASGNAVFTPVLRNKLMMPG